MNTFRNTFWLRINLLFLLLVTACGSGGGNSTTNSNNTPLTSSISIVGTVALDATNSLGGVGNSTQSGTLTLVSSSQASTAKFSNSPTLIAPSSSLSGQIINTNDGIGTRFAMSGNWNGTPATTDSIFSDYTFELVNHSITDTFRVTFKTVFTNTVGATGANSYAFANLSVRAADNKELFFTDQRIDTQSTSNNLDANQANNLFTIDLAPGVTYRFTALQQQRGGAFSTGSYNTGIDAFIMVQSVEKII
jgi:hypothetical protein